MNKYPISSYGYVPVISSYGISSYIPVMVVTYDNGNDIANKITKNSFTIPYKTDVTYKNKESESDKVL